VLKAFHLLYSGITRQRSVLTDDEKVSDGSDLCGNHGFKEKSQVAGVVVGEAVRCLDTVETIDRERHEDCLVIDLTTDLQKAQVKFVAKWLALVVAIRSCAALVRSHERWTPWSAFVSDAISAQEEGILLSHTQFWVATDCERITKVSRSVVSDVNDADIEDVFVDTGPYLRRQKQQWRSRRISRSTEDNVSYTFWSVELSLSRAYYMYIRLFEELDLFKFRSLDGLFCVVVLAMAGSCGDVQCSYGLYRRSDSTLSCGNVASVIGVIGVETTIMVRSRCIYSLAAILARAKHAHM
jgi:hypothetical protein